MNSRNFISDKAAREIESELREAFGSDEIIEEEKFLLVRGELELFEPKDLHGALPYILIGFLRFGISDVTDEVYLGYVFQFLNIRNDPWDRPDENRAAQELARRRVQEREAGVSSFSVREARAIRLWLEAIRGSGVFRLDSSAGEDLGYALAYWREREQGASVDQQRNPLRNECNDIGPPDMSDITDAGNSILVGASWEGFGGCQPEIAPSATLTTDIPSSPRLILGTPR